MDKPRILVVDDEMVIREGVRRILAQETWEAEVAASGLEAIEMMQKDAFNLVITDLKMPGMSGLEVLKAIKVLQPEVPVIVITGYATVETAVEAIKSGASDYIAKPFTPAQLNEKVRAALARSDLQSHASQQGVMTEPFEGFIGTSCQMQKVFLRIVQVAPTDSTVLITGESGTGKELVARAIHEKSNRRGNPFVAVDCTALAENLLESELFGHVKGSFTGAIQSKAGLFAVAEGGTLFLDEVANISLKTQAKLLRILQERAVTPIGATQPLHIDIRLVAATNRNLKKLVETGEFRDDLFFRLNIIPVDLPPLRERKGDICILVKHFVKSFAAETGKKIKGLSPEALSFLEGYHFPGNVRELENIIERAVVLARGEVIEKEDLELDVSRERATVAPLTLEELKEKKRTMREKAVEPVEKAFALEALRRNNWNISRAAEATGMLRPNFQALLRKLGISGREQSDR